jgi:glycosyltransferase involved in cell wall biosynthesis
MKNKILFITNQAPRYRIPFFNKLANKTNIRLVFTNEDKKINGLNTDYILSRGFGWKKYKIHFGLKKILDQEKPLKVIMLPPDPLHLIDNLILYNYCKKKKIPFIFWTERWDYFNLSLKDKISNLFHSKMMRKANKIIVSGKKSFDWVKSLDIRETKIVTAPNASEIEFNKEDTKKRKKELIKKDNLKNEKIILYLGRLINRKGINYLIDAFSKIDNKKCVLLIVGGGDFYKLGEKSIEYELKKQVENLNLEKKIIFTGEIKHEETAAYYSLADIFVYPSITEKISEPWGLTLNEAMQFGLPLISTTAVGAAYDLIKNGKNGFFVNEKKSEELKIAIEKILNNEKLKRDMGKKSEEIIKKNSYGKMVDGFLEALR